MMNAKELAEHASQLFTLPDICMRIQQLLEDPDSTIDDIAKLVSFDPVLTGKVLKLANSPLFSFRSQVSTLSRAVAIIGSQQLYNLVLATAVVDSFGGYRSPLLNLYVFWRQSVCTGLIARELGRMTGVVQGERLFVMGMLHNLGELVVIEQLPEQVIAIEALDKTSAPWIRQQQILGFSYAECGAALLTSWEMPENLAILVGHQHRPLEIDYHLHKEACLLNLSMRAASTMEQEGQSSPDFDYLTSIGPELWQATGLTIADLNKAMEQARMKAWEVLQAILPPAALTG